MTDEEKAEDVLIRLQRQSVMGKQKGIIRRAIEEAKKAGAEEEREANIEIIETMSGPVLSAYMFPRGALDEKYFDKALPPAVDLIAAIRARSDS